MSIQFYSAAPRPFNEDFRQQGVDRLRDRIHSRAPCLRRVVDTAADLFDAPIAALAIVDHDRQWFAASVGLDVTETPRAVSFCAHAIHTPEAVFVV